MKIQFDNIWAHCTGSASEIAQVVDILSYTPKANKYIKEEWRQKRSMYHSGHDRFPVGLLQWVKDKFEGEIELEDVRPEASTVEPQEIALWDERLKAPLVFRDFQIPAVDAAIDAQKGIIKLPPRSGKTTIGVAISQKLNRNTLFVVGTKELLYQTVKEYQNKLQTKDIGIIGDGVFIQHKFTVGIVNSLSQFGEKDRDFRKWLAEIEVVIFDECHHASKTYRKLATLMPKARWKIGISATPFDRGKEGKLQTLALIGPICYELKMSKLIEKKYIAKPIVNFVKFRLDDNMPYDFMDAYDVGIVNNEERNLAAAVIAITELKKGYASLILIEKIQHGHNIEEILKEKCRVKFVYGGSTKSARKEKKRDFEAGMIDVLIASRIYNEGVDIPFLENVIIAGGYKSAVLVYQRNNRGSTKTIIKDNTRIWDFTDEHYYYNQKGELKPGFLYKHGLKRIALCRKEKAFTVNMLELDDI